MGIDDLVNKAKDLAGKGKDIAEDLAEKGKDVAGDVAGKAKEVGANLAEDAREVKDIAQGEGTLSEKAKAAVGAVKDHGAPDGPTVADPGAGPDLPEPPA